MIGKSHSGFRFAVGLWRRPKARRRLWIAVGIAAAWMVGALALDGPRQLLTSARIALLVFASSVLWLMGIGALLIIPVLVVMLIFRATQRGNDARLRKAMEASGRFIEWDRAIHELRGGRGTLIVVHVPWPRSVRYWWTPESVLASSPIQIPTTFWWEDERETDEDAGGTELVLRQYATECARKYVDFQCGTASLTVPPRTKRQWFRSAEKPDLDEGVCEQRCLTLLTDVLGEHDIVKGLYHG